ncbi:ABC transporter substrate-binding protein [soil metagenome]
MRRSALNVVKTVGVAAAMLLMAGAACAKPAPAPAPAPKPATGEPVLVGHYGSLTGPEATFGQSTSNGIKLAIEEINAAGGVNGRPLVLKEYDTAGKPDETKVAVERLVKSDNVNVVFGEVASSLSLVGAPVCQAAGVPMITPSSTNTKVTEVGDYIFRACFIDPFQGLAGAKFAREELKAKTAAVLVEQSSAYAVGLAEKFSENFKKMGGTVATQQEYSKGAQDFTAQLANIRTAKVDVIYIPGYYTDVGNIAQQARKLGLNQPLLGGDGWDSEMLAKIGKTAIEGCYYTNHYAPDQPEARVKQFIASYKKKFDSVPDGLAALGYDAAKMYAAAANKAGTVDKKAVRDALAATKGFPGVTGNITMNAQRDAVKSAVVVEMALDEKTKRLEPRFVKAVSPE